MNLRFLLPIFICFVIIACNEEEKVTHKSSQTPKVEPVQAIASEPVKVLLEVKKALPEPVKLWHERISPELKAKAVAAMFHDGCYANEPELIKMAYQLDPDFKPKDYTPVFEAARRGYLKAVRELVKKFPADKRLDSSGRTIVSSAVKYDFSFPILKLLVEEGVDLNVYSGKFDKEYRCMDRDVATVLYHAINRSRTMEVLEKVEFLLKGGADTNLLSFSYHYQMINCLDLAVSRFENTSNAKYKVEWQKVIKLLETHGAKRSQNFTPEERKKYAKLKPMKR